MSTAASRRLTFLAGLRCQTGVPRCVGRLAAACEDVATALELEVAEVNLLSGLSEFKRAYIGKEPAIPIPARPLGLLIRAKCEASTR